MSEETYRLLRVLQAERQYQHSRISPALHPQTVLQIQARLEKIDAFLTAAVDFHIDSHEPKV